MRPDIRESTLGIKRDGPRVPLPNTQPESPATKVSRYLLGGLHERLSDSAAVKRSVDVEPVHLDGRIVAHARRGRSTAQLNESSQRQPNLGQQGHHAAIANLPELNVVAERLGDV